VTQAEHSPLRVLLVDDSASVRAVLRRFFSWTDDIVVVGEAEDGETAVERVLELSPDVVLMDLVMPGMDGYAATERIMELRPTPIVVLSSRANRNQMRIAFEAMRRGAVEVLGKPEDTGSWRQLADTLPEMVRTAAVAQARPERPGRPGRPGGTEGPARLPKRRVRRPAAAETAARPLRWVGIGASTGGPAALRELLEATPATFPYTLLVVQHITGGFEAGLADWLNREFSFDVRLATDGEQPPPGTVRLAPGGSHLLLEAGGTLRLDRASGPRGGHRPAVDVLFSSMAASHPGSSAGVILTGMGSDGVEGLAELRAAGGLAIAQDEATCVVYGMPRVAVEREAAEIELSPRQIGQYLAGVPRRPGKAS
jgi:two-component system, chemotaxis family, protein-glutamate methylesterase/glutaminase